jgi:uncharacterized membrane protein YeaQ/YmgE (transglycosylase-associated protein family)
MDVLATILVLGAAAVWLEYLTIRACLRLAPWVLWLMIASDCAMPFLGYFGLGGVFLKLCFLWSATRCEPLRGVTASPLPLQGVRSRAGMRQVLLARPVLVGWAGAALAPLAALKWGQGAATAAFATTLVGVAGLLLLLWLSRHFREAHRRAALIREPAPWLRGPCSW